MDHYSSSASIVKITYIRDEKSDTKNSIRKPIAKPWKKEVVPPRVYRVHSKNFKKVVQRLTGALDQPSEPKRLKSLAPPPIETSSTVAQTEEISSRSSAYLLSSSPLANFWREICNDLNDLGKEAQVVAAKTTTNKINSAAVPSVPYSSGLRLPSPCTLNATWPPSFMFLSPGTMASFEDATTVL